MIPRKLKPTDLANRPLAEETKEELTGVATSFRDRAKTEQKRFDDATDSEYWCAFYFQDRAQKEAFLRALKLIDLGDKYIEGQEAARRLGVTLPPGPVWSTHQRSATRLLPLVMPKK
jgi:hypothetical protein